MESLGPAFHYGKSIGSGAGGRILEHDGVTERPEQAVRRSAGNPPAEAYAATRGRRTTQSNGAPEQQTTVVTNRQRERLLPGRPVGGMSVYLILSVCTAGQQRKRTSAVSRRLSKVGDGSLVVVPTIGAMNRGAWLIVGSLVAILLVIAGLALFLRRRANADRSDRTLREARRAIRQSGRDQRHRHRGNIRGKGYGGDDNQGYNAGVSSDGGGMP